MREDRRDPNAVEGRALFLSASVHQHQCSLSGVRNVTLDPLFFGLD